MAVIVEDGSIVSGANSYLSIADCTALLEGLGYTTLQATATEGQLRSAAQYIDSFRSRFSGYKSDNDQSMQWPRYDASIDGILIESTVIPDEIKTAQALAAAELIAGNSLWNSNTSGKQVISETVDVISVTYSENGSSNSAPRFGRIEAMLDPTFKSGGALKVYRA